MHLTLKDGQEPPETINYNLGRFGKWKFERIIPTDDTQLYREMKKTSVYFTDHMNNSLMEMIAKKEGRHYPKEDHWVDVYGYLNMEIV